MSTRTGVGVATGMAIVLTTGFTGCTLFTGSPATSPVPTQATSAPTVTATGSATPTVSATSPSAPPSTVAPAKATGRLSLNQNMLVTKALSGTCVIVNGKPTVTLADHRNDFYGTVDVTIVLSADGGEVTSVTAAFGEDSELHTWKLVHPAKGTSAELVTSGGVYRISGKLMAYVDGAKSGDLLPYSLTATCASSGWLG